MRVEEVILRKRPDYFRFLILHFQNLFDGFIIVKQEIKDDLTLQNN